MRSDAQSTKKRILNCASELFSEKGFEGTSIREIAKAAGVNLAAINYHFENKDNLYWAIYENCYISLDEGMLLISQANHEFEESIWQIYKLMTANGSLMKNTFKIFLSGFTNRIKQLDHKVIKKCGPPGESVIAQLILKTVGEKISPNALEWAVHAIFTNLSHTALITTTDYYKRMLEELGSNITLDFYEQPIKLHARALIHFLKDHKEDLKALPSFPTASMKPDSK